MSVLAGKTIIPMEPKMKFLADAVGTTATPDSLAGELGPLSVLTYKPAKFQYLVRLSAAPTVGSLTVRLKAGATVIRSEVIPLNGVTVVGNSVGVSLAEVAGETPLTVEADITAAADAGITGTLDAFVSIDQPVALTGC